MSALELINELKARMQRAIIGQEDVVERLIIGLLIDLAAVQLHVRVTRGFGAGIRRSRCDGRWDGCLEFSDCRMDVVIQFGPVFR